MPIQLSVPLEIKSVAGREFTGYGSVFNNVDAGGDVVMPGAFTQSLKQFKSAGEMPMMFWMHRADEVPGVWIDMKEDSNGLMVHGEILDTSLGRDVRTLLEKKAVRGLSIGYRPNEVDWRGETRVLKQVDLIEVSIVSMAMNPLARVESMKARLSQAGEYVPTQREIEAWLRELGCSRKVAVALTARMFGSDYDDSGMLGGLQRDADDVATDEETDALDMLAKLTDMVGAASLRRSF